MKHNGRRKILALAAVLLMVLGLFAGCGKKEDTAAVETINGLIAERNEMQGKLAAAEAEIAALKAAPAEKVEVEVEVEKAVPAEYATGVDCTINGEKRVMLSGSTELKCVAVPPEGYAFDHWTIDGAEAPNKEPEMTVKSDVSTVIRAVCVPEHTLTCINCHFQFTDAKGRAKGESYETFNFEKDYKNPVTGEKCEGGKLTGIVTADIPKNKTVEGWLINGVLYTPNSTVKNFLVTELDEQTVYEVVFKGSAPKKTTTDERTPGEDMVYYRVSCNNCTFSGGGYSNASGGTVPAGTHITVYGGLYGNWYGSHTGRYDADLKNGHASSFGYTVNSDCSFTWKGDVN